MGRKKALAPRNRIDKGETFPSNNQEDHQRRNVTVEAPASSSNHERKHCTFNRIYNCYPLSFMGISGMKTGNKIIMPEEALMFLLGDQVPSPFVFEIRNIKTKKISHCGVFEFTGVEDNSIYLPEWMMESLGLGIGDSVNLRSVVLKMGTKIKLQPHTMDFLEMKEPKAVLEDNLQSFCCLTAGDTIMVTHESKSFYVNVVDTEPGNAICITDTDCEVDFAPPLDYMEPEKPIQKKVCCAEKVDKTEKLNNFVAFTGSSRQLSGLASSESFVTAPPMPRGQPISASGKDMVAVPKFIPFEGSSCRLDGSETSKAGRLKKRKRMDDFEEPEEGRMRGAKVKKEEKFHAFTGKKYLLTE